MRFRQKIARFSAVAVALAALPGLVLSVSSAEAAPQGLNPKPIADSIKKEGFDAKGSLAPALRKARGTVTVSVRLSAKPIAAAVAESAIPDRRLPSRSVQRSRTSTVRSQQDRMVRQARKLGARQLGRATRAANVVALSIPARNLRSLAKLPGVVSVKPMGHYETTADPGGSGSLAQAADYVQATSLRAAGYDGTGVRVGVLDSGVDFTHEYLGGPGTTAAYDSCYAGRDTAPTGTCATLFGPTAPKVKGGYDFVGETWPNGDAIEDPDPNPIDFEGHGTHVSDIIGGRGLNHAGIAPGVDLYAVKVCSAVATSCSGVAILEGIDWALDPNGDGDISDALDIINLSLGSSYGQGQDDATVALDNVIRAGVVAVVSAGNSADRPFIVGAPSTSARAISVAQTALPDDKLYPIKVNSPTIAGLPANTVRNSKLQSWSPTPAAALTAPLAQPSDDLLGCTATGFATFPKGAVALVKRGSCNASLKAQNAQAAGASGVVIWNNVPGDPPDFSFGGGADVTVPTFTISFDNGLRLSAAVAAGPVSVTIDPAATLALGNTVVGTSSRGPAISGKRAKPDIGAPGAWNSAEVGTGNGQTAFGGTSGAAPVVTGAAALLLDRYPSLTPGALKARLLNGADTGSKTPDADANLYPTPVSRVGAGEVRVGPAASNVGVLRAWLPGGGNIGLGLPHLTKKTTYPVEMRLSNTGSATRKYVLKASFRDASDQARKAVKISAPSSVTVAGGSTKVFTVKFTIDPKRLSPWPFTHAAGYTGDGSALNDPEYDGFVTAASGTESLHLGWTVLPHRSAGVTVDDASLKAGQKLVLDNASKALDGRVNVFALTGTSPRETTPAPGQPGSPGSNSALVDLSAAGVRDDVTAGILQFAVADGRRQTVPLYPAGHEIQLDTNRDGKNDYAIDQQEAVGLASTGESLVTVTDLDAETTVAYYYLDADFDSSTQVFSVPFDAVGLSAGDTFDFGVLAYDDYFTGDVTDEIQNQTWTVGSAKYGLTSGAHELVVPADEKVKVAVATNAKTVDSTQTGLLLLYDDAQRRDADAVRVSGVGVS